MQCIPFMWDGYTASRHALPGTCAAAPETPSWQRRPQLMHAQLQAASSLAGPIASRLRRAGAVRWPQRAVPSGAERL